MARGPSSERALRWRPVIICLLFLLPTFLARGPSGPAYHCLSVQFAPVMALGSSSERALRRQPSYHLPFVSYAHLYGAQPERASFSLPFCPIFPRYGARPEWASLSLPSVQFAPVMARGPSSERALRRRPSYYLPFVFSYPPLWRAARAGQLIIAFLCNFPPLWRTARPRSERSVGGPVIICLLFLLPTFMARGPSGAAIPCLSAQLWRAAGAGQLIIAFCEICPRYGARPVLGASAP